METLNKKEIEQSIIQAFTEVINWVDEYPENELNKELYTDKWTAAGHIYHLIKSTKAVSQAMKKPKFLLRWTFGKNNRSEKTIYQLKEKYHTVLQKPTTNAPANYSAKKGRSFNKAELIARFQHELDQLILTMKGWNEKQLSKYIVPHPALGKMTIRELLYFTQFHTVHHLNILKEKYTFLKEKSCK